MLMYGLDKPETLNISFEGKGVVYNLSSLKEGYNKLRLLIPPNDIGRTVDREFDIAYMNYVMNNDYVFAEFFQIIYNLYLGNDVFIIYSDQDWSENIVESLLKLIQQRYGYNAVYIETEDDYIYARLNTISDFSNGYGLYNLDQDKERFTYFVESYRLCNNNQLPYNIEW